MYTFKIGFIHSAVIAESIRSIHLLKCDQDKCAKRWNWYKCWIFSKKSAHKMKCLLQLMLGILNRNNQIVTTFQRCVYIHPNRVINICIYRETTDVCFWSLLCYFLYYVIRNEDTYITNIIV